MVLLAITTFLAATTDALPYPGHGNSGAGLAAAVLLFVFNTFFAIGWLGIGWLVRHFALPSALSRTLTLALQYPSEINSLRVRTPANGISTAGNWVFSKSTVVVLPRSL